MQSVVVVLATVLRLCKAAPAEPPSPAGHDKDGWTSFYHHGGLDAEN